MKMIKLKLLGFLSLLCLSVLAACQQGDADKASAGKSAGDKVAVVTQSVSESNSINDNNGLTETFTKSDSSSAATICQLQGSVTSESGIFLAVNSCVAYVGYSAEDVAQQCASDLQKWHDFAGISGKVNLQKNQSGDCPQAQASCETIEAIDLEMKPTKTRTLFHYDVPAAELEGRKKGCEKRHGEFRVLN